MQKPPQPTDHTASDKPVTGPDQRTCQVSLRKGDHIRGDTVQQDKLDKQIRDAVEH